MPMPGADPCIIVNPVAGNGRAQRALARMRPALPASTVIARSTGRGHAEALAREAALAGHAPVICVGGDGTVQEVVHGLMGVPERPALGIVAAGSGNDLARALGLPRDPLAAVRAALGGTGAAIDVGVCNERHFLNVAGVGLDTKVAIAVNARTGLLSRGRLAYIVQALRELRRYENIDFSLEIDGETVETRALLIAIANGRYFAGGMKIAPDADPADGLFDVWIGGDLTRLETLMLMPAIFVGRHGWHPKVTSRRAREVRITAPAGLEVQLDGEILDRLPATFRVLPRALRIAGWQP